MSHQSLEQAKEAVVEVAHLLHSRGLVGGMDGNISVRCGERLVCTPSGTNKGFVKARDLVVTDLGGVPVSKKGVPSSEMKMHVRVYSLRPEINAVVHAHAPHCVACTLVGIELTQVVIPELAYLVGSVPTVAYATPGTSAVAAGLDAVLPGHDAFLLARHGTLTLGRDLMEAYNRLEGLEHAAHVLFLARNLGPLVPMDSSHVSELRDSVVSRGGRWNYPTARPASTDVTIDEIANIVLDKILKNKS